MGLPASLCFSQTQNGVICIAIRNNFMRTNDHAYKLCALKEECKFKTMLPKIESWGTETSEERKRWASISKSNALHYRNISTRGQSLCCHSIFSAQLIRIVRSAVSKELRSSSIKIKWSPASAASRTSFETLMRAVSVVWRAVWVEFIKYVIFIH